MSVTTINLCGNILLKSVKMHFSGNTEICFFFKKSTNLFTGFKIHFFLKIGFSEIVKNRLSQKKKVELIVLKKNAIFDQNCNF